MDRQTIVNEGQKEAYRNTNRQLDRQTQRETETEAETWRQVQNMAYHQTVNCDCELTQLQIKANTNQNTKRYSVYSEDVVFTVPEGEGCLPV